MRGYRLQVAGNNLSLRETARRNAGCFCLFVDGLAEEGDDVGIVMPAGEALGVGADGKDRHRVCRVCVGGPTDMRFGVDEFDTFVAERVD